MSKIYIVKSSKGEYEDYREWNEKAFTTIEKACEYAKELDAIHNSTPDFITEHFIAAYEECCDNIPKNENFYGGLDRDSYLKWQEECYKKEREFLISELHKKGFLVTEEMLDQYEQWEYDRYEEYHDCSIEKLDLE